MSWQFLRDVRNDFRQDFWYMRLVTRRAGACLVAVSFEPDPDVVYSYAAGLRHTMHKFLEHVRACLPAKGCAFYRGDFKYPCTFPGEDGCPYLDTAEITCPILGALQDGGSA